MEPTAGPDRERTGIRATLATVRATIEACNATQPSSVVRRPTPVRPVIPVLLAALVIQACTGAPQDLGAPPLSQQATEERNGLRVSLQLESAPVSGARTWATATVENVGEKRIRWAGGGCGDALWIGIDLGPALDGGRRWTGLLGRFKQLALGPMGGGATNGSFVPEARLPRGDGIEIACPASLSIETLAPGETSTVRAAWDGAIAAGPAPAGPGVVKASFPYIGVEGEVDDDAIDAKPIVAELVTTVLGGDGGAGMSPALAIDAALADPQFAAFVEAQPEATWINPHLQFADGLWGIGLFRFNPDDAQGLEMFGEVRIDAGGAIVGRRFEPPFP